MKTKTANRIKKLVNFIIYQSGFTLSREMFPLEETKTIEFETDKSCKNTLSSVFPDIETMNYVKSLKDN